MKKYLMQKMERWRVLYARLLDIDKQQAEKHGLDDHETNEKKIDIEVEKIKFKEKAK